MSLGTTPKEQSMKEKTGKLGFLKINNLYSAENTKKGMIKQATGWEKTFAKHVSDEGLVSKIYKQ